MRERAWCLAMLAASAFVAGCGGTATRPEAKKYPVTGSVALDGNPMPDGEIYFKTIQTGSLDIVPIKDGKFEGKAQAGDRRVEVYAYREGMSPEMKKMYGDKPPPGTVSKQNYLPAKWNTESKLTANVKESGPNEFKFEISSQ